MFTTCSWKVIPRSQDPESEAPLLKKKRETLNRGQSTSMGSIFVNTCVFGGRKKTPNQIQQNAIRSKEIGFQSRVYMPWIGWRPTNWSIIRAKRKHWLIRKCHKRILKRLQIVGSSNVQQICGSAYLPLVSWLPSNCSCDTTTPKTTKASGEVLVQYPTPINHKTEGFAGGYEPPKKTSWPSFWRENGNWRCKQNQDFVKGLCFAFFRGRWPENDSSYVYFTMYLFI